MKKIISDLSTMRQQNSARQTNEHHFGLLRPLKVTVSEELNLTRAKYRIDRIADLHEATMPNETTGEETKGCLC